MVVSKLKQMLADDGAVSPVIGVILMVAVTVVLAAVISVFVFGIGDSLGQPAPNAQVAFDYNSDTGDIAILHDGGDSITVDNTGQLDVTGDTGDFAGTDATTLVVDSDASAPYTSGDELFSNDGGGSGTEALSSGETIGVQWTSNGGGQSATLGSFEAP